MGRPVAVAMDELTALEIEVAMALGIRSAALVTREVPLKTATGIPVIVALAIADLADAKLCKAEVLIAVALDKTPGKTDFNIPGRAEAKTFGRLETIEAKSEGLTFVGTAVAVIPAEDKADFKASVETEVILLLASTEDKPPDAINEDKLPEVIAEEDKLLTEEVGLIELELLVEVAFDNVLPLTIDAKYEDNPLEDKAPEEMPLETLEAMLEAFEETLAKADESALGSIGVVAVAIIAEILASWEETAGFVAALDIIDCMACTWDAKAGLVAVAKYEDI